MKISSNIMSSDSLPLPEKILALVRYLLLLASPFIAYLIDKPKGFLGWMIFLLTWGIIIYAINFFIALVVAAISKKKYK
jgi:hypothetical protein